MLNIAKDIASLSDFKRNTSTHLECLKETGRPEILTVNGKPEVVVQDVASYQAMLEKVEYVETIRAIQAGIEAHERGEGIPLADAIAKLSQKFDVDLKP